MKLIKKEKIFNWSRTESCKAKIYYPENYTSLKKIIIDNYNSSISFKASGCSYGDCYLNDNGVIIDLNKFDKILEIDENAETINVQCSVKMEKLLNYIMPKGFYLNSIPGSNNATVGGCINSNVHGKDSFLKGVFANNIINLKIMDSNGNIFDIDNKDKRFVYSVGAYGLTYLILEAKLKINSIKSTNLDVKIKKFNNYKEMLLLFDQFVNEKYNMMGAWVDHFNIEGRGIFKCAKWSNFKTQKYKKISFGNNIQRKITFYFIYPIAKIFFVNKIIIKKLNFLLFFFTKEKQITQHFADFYFPQQKMLPEESRLYMGGKVNIQILIPNNVIHNVLKEISILCINHKLESWWLGMKKHKKSKFTMSYAINGYDITLQWSKKYIATKKFDIFYQKLIALVIKNKCLVYLTQDVLLNQKDFENIYHDYNDFYKMKIFADPKKIFSNNLFRRLFKK